MTKKSTVIVISGVTIIAFGMLIVLGLGRAKPMQHVHDPSHFRVAVPFFDATIDLREDNIRTDIWDSLTPTKVNLMRQAMVLPWGKSLASPLRVRAFHNEKDIYFYLQWNDNTEDIARDVGRFPDATAIMFPTEKKVPASTILMGFMGRADIWQWKASVDAEYWESNPPAAKKAYSDFYYPFEEEELLNVSKLKPKSAVTDLVTIRVGTLTPKEQQFVQGKGIWKGNSWHVVMKRSLGISRTSEFDTVFIRETKQLCAFAVWNGSNGDRGGRKSISDWIVLEVK